MWKNIALLLSLSAATGLAGKWAIHEENYTFEVYVKDFRLSFPEAELPMRKELFEQERRRVLEHNQKNAGWKEGLNQFSVMTAQEKKKYFGRNKNMAAKQGTLRAQQSLPADFKLRPVSELPASVDWREKGVVSAVKDQGHCGSCWAFASTATIESHVAIASNKLFDLSVQQTAMCTPNPNHCGGTGGCEGSTAELAFDYFSGTRGLYQEYQWSYTSYYGEESSCQVPGVTKPVASINGYVQLPDNNYTAVMNALATVGPLAINIDASTWHSYVSGVYNGCGGASDPSDINHVVVMVGYGVDEETKQAYWLVRNSWSASWGEQGYIRLLRTDKDEERCQIDNTPQDGVACEGGPTTVTTCGTCGAIYDTSYPTNAKAL
jgi:cathepsin L